MRSLLQLVAIALAAVVMAEDAGEAMDCEMSGWGEWSDCSKSCGKGQQKRSRTIISPPIAGGKACPRGNTQTNACNVDPCPGDVEREKAERKRKKIEKKKREEWEEQHEVIVSLGFDLTNKFPNGTINKRHAEARVREGQDAAYGAFYFAYDYNLSPNDVLDIGKRLQAEMQKQDYEPDMKILQTVNAYLNLGKRLQKEGNFTAAGVEYTRGVLFKGRTAKQEKKAMKKLRDLFEDIKVQSKMEEEAQQKKEEEKKLKALEKEEKKRKKEARKQAKAEMKARKESQEADWNAYLDDCRQTAYRKAAGLSKEAMKARREAAEKVKAAGKEPGEGEDREPVTELGLSLTQTHPNGSKTSEHVSVEVYDGMDASHAAFHFCDAYAMPVAELIKIQAQLQAKLDEQAYTSPTALTALGSAAALAAKGRELLSKGSFVDAGLHYARAVAVGGGGKGKGGADAAEDAEAVSEAKARLATVLGLRVRETKAERAFINQSYEDALVHYRHLHESFPSHKNTTRMLLTAHAHGERSEWADVVRECSRMLNNVKKRGSWKPRTGRVLAVQMGARAAMELGDSKKALQFYQILLKHDPENSDVDREYKRLKNLVKLLGKAKKEMDKGYNHKALDALGEALTVLKGMAVETNRFRSKILLEICKGRSEVKQHEKAFDACDSALEMRNETVSGLFTSSALLLEAYETRASVWLADSDFDAATRDLHAAIELASGDKEHELRGKLRDAEHQKMMWEPKRRNHAKVLDLPVNIHEVNKQSQCTWLKKQFKKLAKQWHPDKYRGDKLRAARKMNEVNDAKETLVKRWGCKGIR